MPFKFSEVEGDLFAAPIEYALGHCVDAELQMKKGVAVLFRDKYCQIDNLRKQNVNIGGVGVIRARGRILYYMVTKEKVDDKPTYADLEASLVSNGVNKLAMPRVGCGIDELNWRNVKELLHKVFDGHDVEIVIYIYRGSREQYQFSGFFESGSTKTSNVLFCTNKRIKNQHSLVDFYHLRRSQVPVECRKHVPAAAMDQHCRFGCTCQIIDIERIDVAHCKVVQLQSTVGQPVPLNYCAHIGLATLPQHLRIKI
ncbi:hypothetical protein HA402_001959 [Bradysia odoriphaga]|nr:hypothetical protein HA402_001959 [Bradysia odoriphaga]